MSDKVKLPKEVSEAITKLKGENFSPYKIVCMMHAGRYYDDRLSVLRKFAVDNDGMLMEALVNGYEVEQTPEDNVRDYYNFCLKKADESTDASIGNSWRSESCGVRNTLIMLDIKISGVNAE